MKKAVIFMLLMLTLGAGLVFSYSLEDSDIEILDRAEDKIFMLIEDQSNPYSAQVFLTLIERALSSYDLSERQVMFLEIIADDISWEYEIGDYAGAGSMIMTADECYDDEYYDQQDQMCYYQEDENYDDDTQYFQGEEIDAGHHEEHEAEILASYAIAGDRITLESGVDDIKNQEVWNIFTSLIPQSVRGDFAKFEITNDTQGDTAAHVQQISGDADKWLLNVNLDAFYVDGVLEPEQSYATLIHEFAHVLTLEKNQVRYIPEESSDEMVDRFADNCQTNLLQEGCLINGAYLNDFINTFWGDARYLERVRNQEVSAYADAPESFITEYAATNPGEDIAESFTYFVLNAKPEGNTIADKKLRFFYNYKQLDSLRKQIRSNLAALK